MLALLREESARRIIIATFLFALASACGGGGSGAGDNDGGSDRGAVDASVIDGSNLDAGSGVDAGSADAGSADAGSADAGSADAGSTDAGSTDAGSTDAGTGDRGSTGDLQLSLPSLSFLALAGDTSYETKQLQATWSNPAVSRFTASVIVPAGQGAPNWLFIAVPTGASPATFGLRRNANPGATGHYTATVRVFARDSGGTILDSTDLSVSLEVLPKATLSQDAATESWTESEKPAAKQIGVDHDARQLLVGASVNVSWLTVERSGDVLTLGGNAASQTLAPGQYAASVAVNLTLEGRPTSLALPVTATVRRALSGPSPLAFEVNAATTPEAISAIRATVSTATLGALELRASTNLPWLAVAVSSTGAPENLVLAIPKEQIAGMENGTYTGAVTVTSTAPNITPLQIPFALTVHLPEVHFVAPVAFTDTAATDYVIIRGKGFNQAGVAVRIAGEQASNSTLVSDTEIRLVPGVRAAGDYTVDVTNQLAITRDMARLRVMAPPVYANGSLDAAMGLQEQVVPTSGAVVFTSKCYMCSVTPGGTLSTVQRFTYDAASGTWSRYETGYPELYDIALSPDESQLIVLTRSDLRLVDPSTMVTQETIDLPFMIGGTPGQLAVTNDGLLLIQDLNRAYSLHDRKFVSVPGLSGLYADGIAGGRDGSRVFWGGATNSGTVPYRYYDASTGQIVLSKYANHFSRGAYTRHAERAFTNGYLLDAALRLLATLSVSSHTGALSPDGMRAYGFDGNTLRILDVSDPQHISELPALDVGAIGIGRSAVHPRGGLVFIAGEKRFVVRDVR